MAASVRSRLRHRSACHRFARAAGTVGVLAALTAALLPAPTADADSRAGGSLPALLAQWDHRELAPGADLYTGVLTEGAAGRWTVTLRAGGAQLLGRAEAETLAGDLREAGFAPRVERVTWPRGSSDRQGTLGVRVRVGSHEKQEGAQAQQRRLRDAGFDADTEWTGADGGGRGGTARVKVAVVDPVRFEGSLEANAGEAAAGREKLTSIASREGALLGVNAGFFVMEEKDGVPGAAAGVAAYRGELQSAATNGRVAAVLPGDGLRPRLRHLSTALRVRVTGTDDGPSRLVDGVNRRPGLIRNCGGVGGDSPTQSPRHDVTCTDAHELVAFTDELGELTPAGKGIEAVLDRAGRVEELRQRGGVVPAGGRVLAGTGAGAAWLRSHAQPGARLALQQRITDEHGRTVQLRKSDDIVNGGPRLVRDGRPAVDFGADGIDRPGEPDAAYAWGLKRNPRTALGVDGRGRLLLVTAEGRQPGYSDGLSVAETARLMASLGAEQAMNLDGGGSTGMTVGGELVTRPSDPAGERAVGDALLLKR